MRPHRPFVAALALTLAACAPMTIRTGIVDSAVAFNTAVEQSHNQILLLNILRAKERRPKYFTTLTTLTTVRSVGGEFGSLKVPFGRGASTPIELNVKATSSVAPTLQQSVLDSKGFTQGLLSPVGATTITWLYNQGWPDEFLLLMLIKEIRIGEHTVRNSPHHLDEFERFQSLLRVMIRARLKFKELDPVLKTFGPPLPIDQSQLLQHQVALAKEGLALDCAVPTAAKAQADPPKCKHFILARRLPQFGWVIEDCKALQDAAGVPPPASAASEAIDPIVPLPVPADAIKALANQVNQPSGDSPIKRSCGLAFEKVAKDTKSRATNDGKPFMNQLVVRSPEGIVYFLGQLARRSALHPDKSVVFRGLDDAGNPKDLRLFDVKVGAGPSDAPSHVLGVAFDEKYYWLGAEDDDRSMATLSFTNLLLALQKDPSEFPPSGVFTLSGSLQ